jgi:hypothetical protein
MTTTVIGEVSAVEHFTADTEVFFSSISSDWTWGEHWGLGYGPTDIDLPQWSLYHCITADRFDSRSVCPQLEPSNRNLLRWITSVVGPAIATQLLESVGSVPDFYRHYFAERPDLRGPVSS